MQTLLRAKEAWNAGDVRAMAACVTEDVVFRTTTSFAGVEPEYAGLDGFVRWRDDMRSAWRWFEVVFERVLHEEPGVVVMQERLHGRGAGSDVDVEMTIYGVYRFRGGRVCSRRSFRDPEPALADARGSGAGG